jgi:hypothetical protein
MISEAGVWEMYQRLMSKSSKETSLASQSSVVGFLLRAALDIRLCW